MSVVSPQTVPAEVSHREAFQPSRRALVATVAAVAATYLYFLIFAQFGFLQAVLAVAPTMLKPIMAVMGAGGLAASVAVAKRYREGCGRRFMAWGFGVCGLAAGLTLVAGPIGRLFAAAALTGIGTGMITVTLAALLRREVGGEKLGICLGAGTGLAYALCNLPVVFNAGAPGHAVIALVACAGGWVAVRFFAQGAPASPAEGPDYARLGIIGWVAVFFALVWLDSAAFSIIQHTPDVKIGTWGHDAQLYLNAVVHLAAALLAGVLLDRKLAGPTVVLAAALLIVACRLIGQGPGTLATGAFCYTAGVSFYSTALVYYPAYCGRVGLAALVYAVAGWIGSALGIGMAENLGRVPGWFLAAAGATVLSVTLLRLGLRRKAGSTMLGGTLLVFALGWPSPELRAGEAAEVGRRVYIAEGCIHCHSQYVRPGTVDEERWGPARGLDELLGQQPPLLGNRRQGPDLLNVALRRTRDWNRAHLIAPRALLPGSRMPSYRHLFTGEAPEGEALLDYLETLRPAAAPPPAKEP